MNGVAEVILQDRKIAYLLVDRRLQIEEIHDPLGLWSDEALARPGVPVMELFPELIGIEDTLAHLERVPGSRLELDFVNRTRPAGDLAYWRMVALPMPAKQPEVEGIIFLVEDVTEQGIVQQQLMQSYNELLLLQRELAQKNLELAAANMNLHRVTETQSVFVSVAAHELRNPLTVILGYAGILLTNPQEDLSLSQRDIVEIIRRSSLQLLEITNNLLDLTRMEQGRIDLLLRPLPLDRPIVGVVREFRPQMDAASQRIDVRVEPDLPLALCDESRTYQIVRNIVSNAHKYTAPGGQIAIHLGRAEQDHDLLITISDSGVGIPPEDQPKLFERFFRASNASATGAPGVGLGLSITRQLVDLHGGRIWFDSQVGKGTTFFIALPIAETEPETDAA